MLSLTLSPNWLYLDACLGVLFLYFVRKTLLTLFSTNNSLRHKSGLQPLPGPRPLPLIGNLLDLPKSHDWLQWTKYKELYGPISSVKVFGTRMVFLNDPQVAFDLLDKKSSIYSDRPCPEFFGKVVGWQHALAFLSSGAAFRASRKQFHQTIGTRAAVARFHPLIEREARRLLWRLAFKDSWSLVKQIRMTAGAVILSISHGYTVDQLGSEPDPLVQLADDAVTSISTAGIWMLDLLPFLRYLPEWIPGMNFTEKARPFKKLLDDLVERPYAFVKDQMAKGTAAHSFTSSQLELNPSLSDEDEHTIKWGATNLYSAGADTIISSLHNFMLAMVLYPDVQKRAREEVDRVTGGERLPTVEDRNELVYVEAVLKEVLRWRVAVPLGLPHVVSEDDVYGDYLIPKGSILFANLWAYTHDAETYADPYEFNPGRFLAENGRTPERDPRGVVFGFGRRICPGKELAEASLFTEMAMILATFEISKGKDEAGNVIEPSLEMRSGVISHPHEFKCTIKPRSEHALELVRTIELDMPFARNDKESLLAGLSS